MEIKLKTKIVKGGGGFMMRVPKTYIDDGNLNLEQEYDVILRPRMWVGRYEHPITDHMAKKAQDSLYYDFAQEATIISFSIESSEVQPR